MSCCVTRWRVLSTGAEDAGGTGGLVGSLVQTSVFLEVRAREFTAQRGFRGNPTVSHA